jgi:hypothetical protein
LRTICADIFRKSGCFGFISMLYSSGTINDGTINKAAVSPANQALPKSMLVLFDLQSRDEVQLRMPQRAC